MKRLIALLGLLLCLPLTASALAVELGPVTGGMTYSYNYNLKGESVPAQLHDGVCRKMGFVPWTTDQPFSREDGAVWGCSVCSEPEGTTIHHSGTVLMADGQFQKKPSGGDEAKIRAVLESLCRPNVLRVLFALSSLTSEDFLNAVTLEELAVACRLSEDRAASALDNIPLEYVENTVEPYFRLAGSYRHMPVLLSLLSMN